MIDVLPHDEFQALIKQADPDADWRLKLLAAAEGALYHRHQISTAEAELLADKFERWRYQILNKHGNKLRADQLSLLNAIGRARSVLWRQVPTTPSPRAALQIEGGSAAAASLARFDAAMAMPIDDLIAQAAMTTRESFQQRITLYAPLYLSNYCINHCTYCAFRFPNQVPRRHLELKEVLAQADWLMRAGFQNLLLVASDFPRLTSAEYLYSITRELSARGFVLGIEIAAQSTLVYVQLIRGGIKSLTLYQETYQEADYARHHPLGPKVWFDWRLEAPQRAADAGMTSIGLGILLGLSDPLVDLRALISHASYLSAKSPAVQLAISLPRIHAAPQGFNTPYQIDDDMLVRYYSALRLTFPMHELVLSTRESPALRDKLTRICITRMSAGSCTAPGGYGQENADHLEQFPIHDQRSAREMSDAITAAGFEVNWR